MSDRPHFLYSIPDHLPGEEKSNLRIANNKIRTLSLSEQQILVGTTLDRNIT
jgi:hypothetical protein